MVDCACANFGVVLAPGPRWEPCPTCGRDLPARIDAHRRGALAVARAAAAGTGPAGWVGPWGGDAVPPTRPERWAPPPPRDRAVEALERLADATEHALDLGPPAP